MGYKQGNNDGGSVLSTKEAMLKNKHHLVSFREIILVSL